MKLLTTGKQIGRTIKNAGRLRVIVGVFARHGFANIAERIKLGRFILERMSADRELETLTVPERIRRSFEELGPTFVKLGQLLATRPDLVPDEFVAEFSKLHARVTPVPFDQAKNVLVEEGLWDKYRSVDVTPLGSASIAQVHRAVLLDGTEVVVKIQRPGIIHTINEDLNVLFFIAELLEKYVDELKIFNPVAIVEEFFKTLEMETNFTIEANNIRRFAKNFANEPDIKIPAVYFDLVTERVLTMEALKGHLLSDDAALLQEGTSAEEIIRKGLSAYLKMVFKDGLFHGDLHAGNFFVLPNNQIGLIDFGVVGRLNAKTQSSIANMLVAIAREDYDRLAYEYVDLAPFDERVNVDLFAKDLRNLIAPFYGLTLKNVNTGKLLMSSASMAAKHFVAVPSELMLFFKSLVAIDGLGRRIQKDFDFLAHALEFAGEIAKHQYEPTRLISDLSQVVRESKNLLSGMPRQLSFYLRKVNSPNYSIKHHVEQLGDLKKSIEVSFNLLFLAVIIGSLILSSSYIFVQPTDNWIAGIPAAAFVGYALAGFLSVFAFINYIKK